MWQNSTCPVDCQPSKDIESLFCVSICFVKFFDRLPNFSAFPNPLSLNFNCVILLQCGGYSTDFM